MDLNGTSDPLQEPRMSTEVIRFLMKTGLIPQRHPTSISITSNVNRSHTFCNENSFEVDLSGTSNPLQELQMTIEVMCSVEVTRTHASATVRMETHVKIFQRAAETVSLRIRFQTFLPALNWAVQEK